MRIPCVFAASICTEALAAMSAPKEIRTHKCKKHVKSENIAYVELQ